LKGAEYGDIEEQLKMNASQELAHALEVARQIDYLGGDPTVKAKEAEYSDLCRQNALANLPFLKD
jgi:bacterioferritin